MLSKQLGIIIGHAIAAWQISDKKIVFFQPYFKTYQGCYEEKRGTSYDGTGLFMQVYA